MKSKYRVGGGVDAGELPIDAAVGEVKEEIGVTLKRSDLRLLGKTKFNHRTKTQINRTFLYSYAVCVPKHDLKFTIDAHETSAVFFISKRSLKFALARHRIKRFGKISSLYAYWANLLKAV